jgi:replicative DNA helicase
MEEMLDSLEIKSFSKVAKEELEYIKDRKSGKIKSLKTSLANFNNALMNGVSIGDIITIAGSSGSGKTMILNMLEEDYFNLNPEMDIAVLNFNFEMQGRRLVGRKLSRRFNKSLKSIYSSNTDMPQNNISDEGVKKVEEYLKSNKDRQVYYCEVTGTIDQVENTITQFTAANPDKWVVVTLDHSGLIKKLGSRNNVDHMYDVMLMFNNMKKQHKISFVVVSQLNRGMESDDRKLNPEIHYPTRSDIWGSDAVYIYSDLVLIIDRPEMRGIVQYGPDRLPVTEMMYAHYIKIRDGEPFIGMMKTDFANGEVREMKNI